MPLLDHFRPPFDKRHHWQAFYHAWATYITDALNKALPEGYFAELNVRFELEGEIVPNLKVDNGHKAAPDPETSPDYAWTPPQPTEVYQYYTTADIAAVTVIEDNYDERLAGVIELVGPSHKEHAGSRSAFISRCQTYLQQRVGLVMVDLVTPYEANLHAGLIFRMMGEDMPVFNHHLYAAAYRPPQAPNQQTGYTYTHLETWFEPLAVGGNLPIVPMWLKEALYVPVDLDATYTRTCEKLRLDQRLKPKKHQRA